MATLQVRGPDPSITKQKAIEDAKKMQSVVDEECTKMGQDSPPYFLSELIGKGSYGRVYKATSMKTNALVAVKIIDIEESDTLNPKLADTYREILNEINALKLLSDSGAKNINHVIDALPVGQSMWMITEYCAGGSVATLMRPTAPGGLQEKWIIPILREVTEAIFWVHRQGIIHRDIKCANVLVTESGGVQLCDFGVAGVIETKFDKRSTFIGTFHWMAPELFDPSAKYGTEVDIWAFGSMVFEIASGLPPNVNAGIDVTRFGSYLKQHTPRLEGDQYSPGLKDLVAYCLEEDPARRPTIEEVQHHQYIFNTTSSFPTSTLALLVRGYKLWEAQGGIRKSLFAAGGAQGPLDLSSMALANDEWNFSSTAAFDLQVLRNTDSQAQAVFDAYGTNVDFNSDFPDETSRPSKPKPRRRPPPQALNAMKVPLEKVFDPNTISSYDENSRAYYGKPMPPPTSDLPLRDDSLGANTVRESLIDLDASLHGSELSRFVDMDTIKVGGARASVDYNMDDTPDFSKPPLSDPELNNNRRTKDWKFPPMPPASANPEMSRFPFNEERTGQTPGSGPRPPLLHHPTEPIPSMSYGDRELMVPRTTQTANRVSAGSLIDLDMSMPDPVPELTRPSTANSDVASVTGSDIGQANPFDLERHASLYIPPSNREPSIYVSDDSEFASRLSKDDDFSGPSDFSGPGNLSADDTASRENGRGGYTTDNQYSGTDYSDNEYAPTPQQTTQRVPRGEYSNFSRPLPPPPAPPSERVMQGVADSAEIKADLARMIGQFADHLHFMGEHLDSLPRRRTGPRQGDHTDDEAQ
jgi:serine/threonine protein kinase